MAAAGLPILSKRPSSYKYPGACLAIHMPQNLEGHTKNPDPHTPIHKPRHGYTIINSWLEKLITITPP